MCNAHNHPPGCQCGWGPPYPDVVVTVREVYKISKTSSKAAMLNLKLPIKKTQYFNLLDDNSKGNILKTATKNLQQLADEWFGKDKIKVVPVEIKKGSIELIILLCLGTMSGTILLIYKNKDQLERKFEEFSSFISRKSLKLFRAVKKSYAREEQKSLRASKTIFEES